MAALARGNPRIQLQDGRDLAVNLGESAIARLKESGIPLALASADFDGDGVPDLLAGYRMEGRGVVTLFRGNVDAIFPNSREAAGRRERGEFTDSPFLPVDRAFELPEAPELMAAGDFDRDGYADLLFTSRGSGALYLLRGNGRGFGDLRVKDLPGAVTAVAAGVIDPRAGNVGVAVAVLGRRGPALLVFPSDLLIATPEKVPLRAPATALALGQLDDDRFPDLVAACGSEFLLLHGRPRGLAGEPTSRIEWRSLPFAAAAVTTGLFGTASREGVALVSEAGGLFLLTPRESPALPSDSQAATLLSAAPQGGPAPRPFFPNSSSQVSGAMAARAADLKDWDLTEAVGEPVTGGRAIVTTRLSGAAADDLVVVEEGASRLHVVSATAENGAAPTPARTGGAGFERVASLDVSGNPVAVLPMRLNPDALSDLVVLHSGSIAPAVVLTAAAATLTVNSAADTPDASPGNGICADSGGNCTLRAAIQEADALAGADTINFAIPGAGVHTISVTSSLPTITGAVTIDGTTQPGYSSTPLIELSGPVSGSLIGLTLNVSDCVVRGLAVNTFHGTSGGIGIYIVTGGPLVKNALLEANFIGTDATGTIAKPNHIGISIQNTSLNTIGGTTGAARNLISGNDYVGVQIFGASTFASGNVFQGNYIGTTVTGGSALFNAEVAFNLFADSTLIGGAAAGAGNVISGNGDPGANSFEGHGGAIDLNNFCSGSCAYTTNTIIKANKIGTNPAGTAAVGNLQHGIWIISPGAPNTTIANNLISGNGAWGIKDEDSMATLTTITGNFIGTNVTGTAKISNTSAGLPPGDPNTVAGILAVSGSASAQIVIGGTSGTTAGGPCTGSCNLISGNDPIGVFATGTGPITISDNFIGTNAAGTAALANVQGGVVLGPGSKVLGSSSATGNVVSGNGDPLFGGFGVYSLSTGSPGNTIKGNLIGTNVAGTAAVANIGDGVFLGASDTLGSINDPNIISGNLGNGVTIPSGASFCQVLGNRIGVKSTGAALGNGFDGVNSSASDVTIQANQIAYNPGNGVTVLGSAVRDSIRGNTIHHNSVLGIDLGGEGVTPNDAGDGDSGPNDLMNFPDGITATWDPTHNQTTFNGHVDTINPNTVSVDLFANSIHDPSDHGQGEVFLGSATPDTNGYFCVTITGLPPFVVGSPPSGTLAAPPWISATTTNLAGSTSEFSATSGSGVELVALEVNQTIQDWTNSVPLIKDKPTYVRAHIQTSNPAGPAIPITVQLRGFQSGFEIAGSPLTPFNYGVYPAEPNAAARRQILNSSANFRLPDSWLNGTVELRLERTDGPIACKEANDAGSTGTCGDCRTVVTFTTVPKPSIQLIAVKYTVGGTTFNFGVPELDQVARIIKAVYPVSDLNWTPGTLDWTGRRVPASHFEDKITAALRTNWFADLYGNTIYFGVIPGPGGSGVAAAIPSRMASGFIPTNFFGYGRATPPHEIGHALGRSHTVPSNGTLRMCGPIPGIVGKCNDCSRIPPDSGYFPNFFLVPFPSGYSTSGDGIMPTLGPMNLGDSRLVYGLDTSQNPPVVIDPNRYFDLMSYCAVGAIDLWNSDYTYNGLKNSITSTFGSRRIETQAPKTLQNYLVVQGRVNFALNAVQLLPVSTLASSTTPPSDPAGSYTLRLLDGVGGVVEERTFEPVVFEGRNDNPNLGMFWVAVTPDPTIRQAVVLKDGAVVASRTASAHAPTVSVVFPNGGETVTQDPVPLQWIGGDADGDPLTYDVQYSADGGTTWKTLVSDHPSQTYSIPSAFLTATTNGLIKVTAKDGFWSTSDQSNAVFTVPNHAPFVSILSPTAGQAFAGSQQIVFEASARDIEDGALSGASLQWSSSIDGALGTGATLLKQASQLSPGNHTITVTATDSATGSAFATVNISVAAAPVATSADLAVTQEAAPNPPAAGAPLIYTVTVTNNGKDPATAAALTDTLPSGVAFGSANPSQGSCSHAGSNVTCNLGTLAENGTATITIAVTPLAPGALVNVASVGSGVFDPLPANNTRSDSTTAVPAPPSVTDPANETICPNGPAVFSVTGSGTAPLHYSWQKDGFELTDGGPVSGSQTPTLTINPTTSLDAGQYDVVVSDDYGQSATSAAAVLTFGPGGTTTIAAPASVDPGATGLTASVPPVAGATYAWSITGGSITSGAATAQITFTAGASGSVHLDVTVTDTAACVATGSKDIPITTVTPTVTPTAR